MRERSRQTLIELVRSFEKTHGAATALTEATRWNLCDEVNRLLDSGIDPNIRFKNGGTALMSACTSQVARLLVERGADVNARDNDGRTALIWFLYGMSSKNIAKAYIKTLISLGADVSIESDKGETAEELARSKYGDEMAQILRSALPVLPKNSIRGRKQAK